MKLSKLTKTFLTTFLAFYLTLSSVKAQEQKAKEIEVNKKKYSLLEDRVTTEDNLVVRDKEVLSQVLKTSQIQEEIDSLNLNPAALKALELYAKGQELTMKYSDYIDWTLRLPFKILARILLENPPTLEEIKSEFKEFHQEKLKETAGEIGEDPEKQLKFLAYAIFSNANEKAKFNLTILKTKPALDYETAEKFENNFYFINIFMKPSQQLYFDVENIRKLEERWTQTFIEEVKDALPERVKELTDKLLKEKWMQKLKEKMQEILPEKTKELTDKILEGYEDIIQKRLEELEPYKKFQDEISKRKEECEKSRIERQKALEEKVGKFIRSIKYDDNIIIYISDLTGNFEIYSMDKDGKNKIQLTNNGLRNLHPRWTPDKRIIFCINTPKQNTDIYVMDKEGSNLKQLTNTPEYEGESIMLSDGRLIFLSNKNGKDDIYIKENDGTIKQLTKTEEDESSIDVSSDERLLLFERPKGKNYGVFILNIENGLERKIENCGGIKVYWSPDNNKIFGSNGHSIKITDIKKGIVDEIEGKQLRLNEERNSSLDQHIIYPCGWIDNDTIIYRNDLVKLPHNAGEAPLKNIYTFNLKTKEVKKLTDNGFDVWNDLADCLKK